MSIENAILELAAAIHYHADKTAGGTGRIASLIENVTCGGNALVPITADAIEQDVTKVETEAKAAQQKAMDKVSTGKAEIAAALEKAKAEKAASTLDRGQLIETLLEVRELEKSVVALEAEATIDYETDIKPRLIMLGKDKGALVALLGKYNAKKGTDIAKSDYAAIYHEAGDLIAARG